MKKKGFWSRLSAFFEAIGSVFNVIHLFFAFLVGIAAAYVLGSVFGMGAKGYALGFVLGVGIVLGGISIG